MCIASMWRKDSTCLLYGSENDCTVCSCLALNGEKLFLGKYNYMIKQRARGANRMLFVKVIREATVTFLTPAEELTWLHVGMQNTERQRHISMEPPSVRQTFVVFLQNLSNVSSLDLCICACRAANKLMGESGFCRWGRLLCLLNSTSVQRQHRTNSHWADCGVQVLPFYVKVKGLYYAW